MMKIIFVLLALLFSQTASAGWYELWLLTQRTFHDYVHLHNPQPHRTPAAAGNPRSLVNEFTYPPLVIRPTEEARHETQPIKEFEEELEEHVISLIPALSDYSKNQVLPSGLHVGLLKRLLKLEKKPELFDENYCKIAEAVVSDVTTIKNILESHKVKLKFLFHVKNKFINNYFIAADAIKTEKTIETFITIMDKYDFQKDHCIRFLLKEFLNKSVTKEEDIYEICYLDAKMSVDEVKKCIKVLCSLNEKPLFGVREIRRKIDDYRRLKLLPPISDIQNYANNLDFQKNFSIEEQNTFDEIIEGVKGVDNLLKQPKLIQWFIFVFQAPKLRKEINHKNLVIMVNMTSEKKKNISEIKLILKGDTQGYIDIIGIQHLDILREDGMAFYELHYKDSSLSLDKIYESLSQFIYKPN